MNIDFLTWAKDCNSKVKGSNQIGKFLSNPDIIDRIRKRLISSLGESPELGLLIIQLTYMLHQDDEFELIACKECSDTFVRGTSFIWFCFWCSITIYENIRRQITIKGVGIIV